jgi:LmbE family N-acetylglucosaminyl deacetylase
MLALQFAPKGGSRRRLHILAIGAHCDDVDIGCGGATLALLERYDADVTWVVFAANAVREREFRASAARFLRGARNARLIVHKFRDGFFPAQYVAIKEAFETLKNEPSPDLIFSHRRADLHQDHRIVAELTWNTFRDHLILEYEVAKYEGDLTTPSSYVELTRAQMERKVAILWACYKTQRAKRWFTPDTFRALMRIRGIESGGKSGWAEGFHASKTLLG